MPPDRSSRSGAGQAQTPGATSDAGPDAGPGTGSGACPGSDPDDSGPAAWHAASAGRFTGLLRWEQIDALIDRLRADPAPWFVYDTDRPPPAAPADPASLAQALDAFLALNAPVRRLRDVAGTAYVDDPDTPAFVKLFDPWRMGSSCGGPGHAAAPPRWILSRLPPAPLIPPAPTEQAPKQAPKQAAGRPLWRRILGR